MFHRANVCAASTSTVNPIQTRKLRAAQSVQVSAQLALKTEPISRSNVPNAQTQV